MKLTIGDKEVELRHTMRALMMYENIKKESFVPKTIEDVMVFMWCTILASDRTVSLTFDKMIDMVDEDPTLFERFAEWMTEGSTRDKMLANELDTTDAKEVSEEEKKS